jgi:hypothetical protein
MAPKLPSLDRRGRGRVRNASEFHIFQHFTPSLTLPLQGGGDYILMFIARMVRVLITFVLSSSYQIIKVGDCIFLDMLACIETYTKDYWIGLELLQPM